MDSLKPVRLEAVQHEKIWGATQLEPWFPNTEGKTGEVWFAEPDSPILVKFLFTTENLSVQVHPGDEYAARYERSRGKTEMWHILRAEPGAKIALGLRQPVSAEELRRGMVDGSIMEMLRWYTAEAGQTYFVPAGAVHAIGAGIALCEIQQNSDVTYRLYDYGRPRELHIEQSMATSDLAFEAMPVPEGSSVLAECAYFRTVRVRLAGELGLEAVGGGGKLMIALAGEGRIGGYEFQGGEVWKLPVGGMTSVTGDAELLTVEY